ncbi:MAG: hypothetical protein FD143_1213 [Ignavibacteria bacterium]|nr:MAG: hypothetical protein FD143_1213 [Ignavibacteria bacterium]KAF0160723.1 MAG: hypothetical protein FD188_1499 [Ignavibacteria bacterium]
MKRINVYFGLVLFAAIMFSSCKNDNADGIITDESIPPVITTFSTANTFKYNIVAVKYTKQEVYELKVTADSIRYSLSAASIKSGQMEVIVELKDGSKLLSRNISGVTSAADYRKVKSPLSKITLNYSNYTGEFTFNLNDAY